MANGFFDTLRDCQSSSIARGSLTKLQKHFSLFPAIGTFKSVAMDILGPLPNTKSVNCFIVLISDLCFKWMWEILINDTTALLFTSSFRNDWGFPYVILNSILTDNGPRFIAQFFRYVCSILGIKRIPITTYHPGPNGQT